MRRCTNCFRFQPGSPTFCARCGRSFNVRICSRGHANPRSATFCSECGSADLSTPAPPTSALVHLSGLALYGIAIVAVSVAVLAVVVALIENIDMDVLAGPLVVLVLMLLLLQWLTNMLPTPVRKVGKAAGKGLWKVITNKRKQH